MVRIVDDFLKLRRLRVVFQKRGKKPLLFGVKIFRRFIMIITGAIP